MFLDKLKQELLNEEKAIIKLPNRLSDFLLHLKATGEELLYRLLAQYTDWWWMDNSTNKDGSPREATMGVAIQNGRVQFFIGETFYKRLSKSQLAFLMYHELSHITRGHCNNNFKLGKSDHNLANICEDIYINEDANKDKSFGGIPMAMVDGVLMKETGQALQASTTGIDLILEKSYRVPKDIIEQNKKKYLAYDKSIDLYNLIASLDQRTPEDKDPNKDPNKDPDKDPNGDPKGPPPPPQQIKAKKGDIIRGPDGQYGRVSRVMGNKVKQIEPLTKEEAESIVKGITTFISVVTRRSLNNLPKEPINIS